MKNNGVNLISLYVILGMSAALSCGSKKDVNIHEQTAYCGIGPLSITLKPDWSCFQATEKGKSRGLGIIVEGKRKASVFVIDNPNNYGQSVKGTAKQVAKTWEEELTRLILNPSELQTLKMAPSEIAYFEGSVMGEKRMRREGAWRSGNLTTRFVQVYTTEDKDNGLTELRDLISAFRIEE